MFFYDRCSEMRGGPMGEPYECSLEKGHRGFHLAFWKNEVTENPEDVAWGWPKGSDDDGRSIICPRCTGFIPNPKEPGAYPGATSRLAPIEVCSACGLDEAMRDFSSAAPIPPDEWPIGG